MERRVVGEVINGGKGGWFGFDEGDEIGEGDVAGDIVVSSVGDITAAILRPDSNSLSAEPSFYLAKVMPKLVTAWPASLEFTRYESLSMAQEQILGVNIYLGDSVLCAPK